MKLFIDAAIRWYDNGIYYPNVFLLVIAVVATCLATGIIAFMLTFYNDELKFIARFFINSGKSIQKTNVRRLGKWLVKLLRNDPVAVLIVLLAITLFTRFSILYSGHEIL